MHRYRRSVLSLVLALVLASMPLSQDIIFSDTVHKTAPDPTVKSFAIGPGIDNLSLGDAYATYQWGLKNDGEFRLTQISSQFQTVSDSFGGTPDASGEVGIPKVVGPGAYEASTTFALPGIDINILPAWDIYEKTEQKRAVTVAVIDTGIDYTHPELQNAMWRNPGEIPDDGIDNDGNGYVDDIFGWDFYHSDNQTFHGYEDIHGTHAAGTIAANKGALGITGITDNRYVKIMTLKTLGGAQGSGTTDAVIKAIQYAEANGASICNLSFGTTVYDGKLEQAISNSKMLFIIAAGNGNDQGQGYSIDESPVYPASFSCDNIISTANLLFDGNLNSSSNYGAANVDIAAPGSYILSTVPDSQYGFMSGTSMAAPMVTGAAAMLYSSRPDIGLSDVKNILLASARKTGSLNGKLSSGGMLDVYAALSYR